KPWTQNQKAEQRGPGVWRTNGGLAHSDMGSQFVIEAPEGLILIDCNSGHSFEQNWARMRGAGLDPMAVRYVLLTHEHGDHAPGAYLWRVVTGARVVAGRESAYVLQHCLPAHTGYGFHPPNPVDIVVDKDQDLELAGLTVRAVRVPGHTWGSTAWLFRKGDKSYAATGDLIMPGGTLGYDGSVDFTGPGVLDSLRKIARARPDVILGGHGGGTVEEIITKGIRVGEATGWGKMKPEKPDPLHGFATRDYLVAAWLEKVRSAVFGDVDGDGRCDVAVLVPSVAGEGRLAVKVYRNRGGRFGPADAVLELPEAVRSGDDRLLIGDVNGDKAADFLVSGHSARGYHAVLLMSREGEPAYRSVLVGGLVRTARMLPADLNGDGLVDLILLNRFAADAISYQTEKGGFRTVRAPWRNGMDLVLADVNADGRADLVTSGGDVLLRLANGTLSAPAPSPLQVPKEWTWLAAADFNGDRRAELVLLSNGADDSGAVVRVFDNTGEAGRPFAAEPTRTFPVPQARVLRTGATVADFNGDGHADVVLTTPQRDGALILLGGAPGGLDPKRRIHVKLDFQVHHDTPMGVADFDGDGRPDIAAFGHSHRTVPGVFIRLSRK
ncbi:MAG: FG-GAP-like repeat-containing protein, partial [Phycisphaerae bacterium]